ncbi:MAG: hypothetical protein HFF90_05035 [Oscillibacter sp.]|nr:hypothetical protein [Oscillibacter sp.]
MRGKTVLYLILLCSISILALVVLHLTGVWENAIYVYEPLIGGMFLLQAFQNRESSRGTALISLVCGVLILAVSAFIILFR